MYDVQLADGGRTSNLMNHLQAKHPQEYKRLVKNSKSAKNKEKQIVLNHGMLVSVILNVPLQSWSELLLLLH